MRELPMSEDSLVAGLMDAFALYEWEAWHVRRSDRALLMGRPGWPDITALPPGPGPLLVIEAKTKTGRATSNQARWLVRLHQVGVTTALIRPADYDRAVGLIASKNSEASTWDWAFRP